MMTTVRLLASHFILVRRILIVLFYRSARGNNMYTVSISMLVVLIIDVLVSLAIPIGLYVVLRRRFGCARTPFFLGAATFFLFAMVLEQLVHLVVLRSSIGAAIQQNIWLFALYGGAMAALFEEGGRLIVFSTLLKKRRDNDHDALMFGAGHGGMEVILIFTITMVMNLYYALMIRSGRADALLASMEEGQRATTALIFTSLSTASAPFYLLGLVERFAAVILHLSFSVLVWFALKGKFSLLYLAVLLHFAVDAITVVLSRSGLSPLLLEVLVVLFSLLCALIARWAWKAQSRTTASDTQ